MNDLKPIDAASCRALAIEACRWANTYAARGETQKALQEIEWARTLCLKALKFEQEQQSLPTSSTAAKGPALDAPQMPGHQFEGII